MFYKLKGFMVFLKFFTCLLLHFVSRLYILLLFLLFSSHLLKWCTCQLKYPCSDLDAAFIDLIEHLEKSHKNHAALPVASAVSSRTKYLLGGGQKSHLFLEAERRKTFVSWPHKEYRFVEPTIHNCKDHSFT